MQFWLHARGPSAAGTTADRSQKDGFRRPSAEGVGQPVFMVARQAFPKIEIHPRMAVAGAQPDVTQRAKHAVYRENGVAKFVQCDPPTDVVTNVLGLRIGMTAAELDSSLVNTGLPLFADAKPVPDAPAYGPLREEYVAQNGDVTPQFQWADGWKLNETARARRLASRRNHRSGIRAVSG